MISRKRYICYFILLLFFDVPDHQRVVVHQLWQPQLDRPVVRVQSVHFNCYRTVHSAKSSNYVYISINYSSSVVKSFKSHRIYKVPLSCFSVVSFNRIQRFFSVKSTDCVHVVANSNSDQPVPPLPHTLRIEVEPSSELVNLHGVEDLVLVAFSSETIQFGFPSFADSTESMATSFMVKHVVFCCPYFVMFFVFFCRSHS